MLVAQEEEESVDQLRKVLQHVHARLVVQHLRVMRDADTHGDPGHHQATDARVVHRQILLEQGNELVEIDRPRLGHDLLQQTVQEGRAECYGERTAVGKDILRTSVSTSEKSWQSA